MEAWQMTRAQWKARAGVHTPHIGEVSTVQLGRMSRAARTRYDNERRAEWQASADASNEYARRCVEAYDADASVIERASDDARSAILGELARRQKEARAERLQALAKQNVDVAAAKPGDRVWWVLGGRYVRVVAALRVSLRITVGDRQIRVNRGECQWLCYNDLVAAEAAGRTVDEQRVFVELARGEVA